MERQGSCSGLCVAQVPAKHQHFGSTARSQSVAPRHFSHSNTYEDIRFNLYDSPTSHISVTTLRFSIFSHDYFSQHLVLEAAVSTYHHTLCILPKRCTLRSLHSEQYQHHTSQTCHSPNQRASKHDCKSHLLIYIFYSSQSQFFFLRDGHAHPAPMNAPSTFTIPALCTDNE